VVLEFIFDYKSSSLLYEKILSKMLVESQLKGKLSREDNLLKLYIESENTDLLEKFANDLSLELPHSIFLRNTEVNVVESMSEDEFILPNQQKRISSFCPSCLDKVLDESNEDYYNPFRECDVCGYESNNEHRSYKDEFEKIAKSITQGSTVKINTLYGQYYIGKLSEKCNDISFDILSYDLASISKYTNASRSEIVALGAIEKPLINLKTNLKFKVDFEDVQEELLRFKLADDFILHLIMLELHNLVIDLVFISKDKMEYQDELLLTIHKYDLEPIECVVGENHIVILNGNKGLPDFELSNEVVIPFIGAFNSVIMENSLEDNTVVGMNLSKDYHNNILIYSKKFGLIEYLSFKSELKSISEVFEVISNSDEKAEKLINSYKNKYSDDYQKMSKIIFDDGELNIYKLWGIISIVLGFSTNSNLYISADILEKKAKSFVGTKGPRIDYKLKNIDSKVYLDPLMVIRTAMTFRLAGVDDLSLSYGVVESFVEFLSGQLDDIKQDMNNDVVVATGSLLGNHYLFSKLDKEVSVNHNLYFNNELPVDGINIQYGGNSLIND